ncbi:DUF6643 family protein [Streptomyces sp. NPDC092296]|uniref:DUF6643 family protein n=1 Tax=Streptomyces sp. NPDC092296 TaxID=3366012 RepID=UPI003819F7CF
MTSPRSFDGVGYYAPSFSSDTPIYDSLVAERGVPQIAPINVPAALPPAAPAPYEQPRYSGYESGSNLPALPARPALGPGPSTTYMPAQPAAPQYAAAQQVQQYPPTYVPGQRGPAQGVPPQGMPAAAPQYGQGQPGGYGYPSSGQSFGGNGLRPAAAPMAPVAPVAPVRPMPQRPAAPNQYGDQQQYPRGGQGY